MKIDFVSDSLNFKGYIHKSVYKHINSASDSAINELYATSRRIHNEIDFNHRDQILKMRDESIELLDKFMSETHPDTYMKIVTENKSPKLIVTNKKLRKYADLNQISLFNTSDYKKQKNIFDTPFRINDAEQINTPEDDLIFFHRFVKSLSELVNPKTIDERLLNITKQKIKFMHARGRLIDKLKIAFFYPNLKNVFK